ncbi:MAG: signal peptidase II [Alphaproteobacteria bacterium]|jgi:signal peptidase II|nr:signal peptidase II [Alphaproteobacteria bacterium]MCV6599430.1 signal peptidase II [Alphaproteobacteria bacterium]
MINSKKISLIGYATSIIIVILDQLSKHLILGVLDGINSIKITKFFNLSLVYNRGISFGMINGGSLLELSIIATITLSISIILINWLRKSTSLYKSTSIALILGGAIGNAIDRFLHIGVVDFLDFHFKNYHFPAFNVADSCIFIGVVLMLLENVFIKGESK